MFPVPQGLHRGKLQAKMTESTPEFNDLMRERTAKELSDLTPPRGLRMRAPKKPIQSGLPKPPRR